MKKVLFGLFIAAALFGLSCKTTAGSTATIEGEVTQEKVNDALNQVYGTYRSRFDLTNAQQYTVQAGDSLSEITRRFYGNLTNVGNAGLNNGFYFPILMAASNHVVVDPDLIEPGMRIVIPDLQRNLSNSSSRRAIKECLLDVSHIYNRKGQRATEQGLIALSNSL